MMVDASDERQEGATGEPAGTASRSTPAPAATAAETPPGKPAGATTTGPKPGPAAAATAAETPTDKTAGGNSTSGESSGSAASGAKTPPLLANAVLTPPPKPSRWPVFLVFLIALGAAGGAGYTYWQLDQLRNARQGELQAVTAVAESLQAAKSSQEDEVAALAEALRRQQDSLRQLSADQQDAIRQLMERVGNANRRIAEITNVSRQSWMLAEAEYLLRLANQRLVVEQAVASSLALLRATDRILVQIDDVNLIAVRGQLAKEIASLQAIGELDIEGVFLRLSALAEQAATLALLLPATETASGQEVGGQTVADDLPTVTEVVDSALDGLRQLVQIRRRDIPVQPLLTPEQHYYVQQNLRLMLEQAQLALLQRRQPLYQRSLASARQWINDYFQLNPAAQAVITSLEELQTVDVAAPLPDISASLGMLKAYLDNTEQPAKLSGQGGAAGASAAGGGEASTSHSRTPQSAMGIDS